MSDDIGTVVFLLLTITLKLNEDFLCEGALVEACYKLSRFSLFNGCVLIALESIEDFEHEGAQILDGGVLELLAIDSILKNSEESCFLDLVQ